MVLQLCNNPVQIFWISMQSVVTFICLLQVCAICLRYSHDDVIGQLSQIFIVLLEFKLQYSCICCCIVCALRQAFIHMLLDKQEDF